MKSLHHEIMKLLAAAAVVAVVGGCEDPGDKSARDARKSYAKAQLSLCDTVGGLPPIASAKCSPEDLERWRREAAEEAPWWALW